MKNLSEDKPVRPRKLTKDQKKELENSLKDDIEQIFGDDLKKFEEMKKNNHKKSKINEKNEIPLVNIKAVIKNCSFSESDQLVKQVVAQLKVLDEMNESFRCKHTVIVYPDNSANDDNNNNI